MELSLSEKYVDDCIAKGINNISEMCDLAVERCNEIDKKIKDLIELKVERDKLSKILRELGYNKPIRKKKINNTTSAIVNIDTDTTYKQLMLDICSLIEENGRLTSREVIEKLGYDTTNPEPIYLSIKRLFEKGIILRNSDRSLDKGLNWDNRKEVI